MTPKATPSLILNVMRMVISMFREKGRDGLSSS
jgi:hypothetical protein